jgi:hypothetical protein
VGEQQAHGEWEQAVFLVSFNVRFCRLKEEECEFISDANFKHAVEISRQWAITKEAGRFLMAAA